MRGFPNRRNHAQLCSNTCMSQNGARLLVLVLFRRCASDHSRMQYQNNERQPHALLLRAVPHEVATDGILTVPVHIRMHVKLLPKTQHERFEELGVDPNPRQEVFRKQYNAAIVSQKCANDRDCTVQ